MGPDEARWGQVCFQDLIDAGKLAIGDGYRAKNEELGGDGPIFLRAAHVRDTHIDFAGVERFHRHLAGKVEGKLSQPGDVVVTTKGNSTGRVSYVKESLPRFVYSPHLSYWRSLDEDVVVRGYLRYWSQSREFRRQLEGLKASTDMAPYLSLADQRRLKLTVPPRFIQRAIAEILGALDDKIELNRKTNETLEATARAIFKSWFVDFDPVRAKAEGRQPAGMDAETAALFPDSFEDSELGKIPKGWDIGYLGDVATQHEQKEHPQGAPGELFWHYSIPAFDNGRRPRLDRGAAIKSQKSQVPPRSVLLSKLNPEIERVWLVDVLRGERSVCSTEFLVLLPQDGWSRCFLYGLLCASTFRRRIESLVTGTSKSHQRARPKAVMASPIVVPAAAVAGEYESAVGPLFDLAAMSRRQVAALEATRDTLLPKLLSGELRVKGAEKVVGEAT